MEFHQDIGTAAYVSVIQNQPVENNDQAQQDYSDNFSVDIGSISYAKSENINIQRDQVSPSTNLSESLPRFHNTHEEKSDVNLSRSLDDTWTNNENIISNSHMNKPIKNSLLPLSINKDSIESVESLICPPVATASTGKSFNV